jgi:tRNA pseudouridine13 synthase
VQPFPSRNQIMSLDLNKPLPLLTASLPGIGGKIKETPEDFEVEEIPAYPCSGSGSHLFLWVEKRDMGAEFFARQIARRLDIPVGEVGTAGLKDRRAVTRQWVSVPEMCQDRVSQLEGDGIRVLDVQRHDNKLRPGHLRGNRFRILIRETVPEAEARLPSLVEMLKSQGMPNYYGPQRFGRDGDNAQLGMELLTGTTKKRLPPFLRKLVLSSVQSAIFNQYLAQRMRDGLLRQVLDGDVMAKWPAGGMFVASDFPREQERFDARETVHAGPIFGRKTFAAASFAAAREAAVLEATGLSKESFRAQGKLLQGTRRHNLIYVDDLHAVVEPDGVRLTVTLPAGSYATTLLNELMKCFFVDSDVDAPYERTE